MSWPEPALFLWGLFAMTTLGALLPLDVGRHRQDHIVLTITATVVLALLGPRGLLLVWGAVVVAFGLRRADRWLPGTTAAITVGFSLAHLTYAVLLDRSYPLLVATGHDFALSCVVLGVAWIGTMSVRVALHRASSPEASGGGHDRHDGFDAFDSPLVPYLLPTVAGAPILAAALALYGRDDPWSALAVLLWCLPLYGACRFDLHRQRLAQALRREAVARQRLAAIGEVTARVVHQSRHQAGLMGWSIHRLRRLVDDPSPEGTAAARRELDVLAAAKQRIQETFDTELLHEPTSTGHSRNGSSRGRAATPPTLAETLHDVCAQLAGKAQHHGVTLDIEVAVAVDAPGPPALREVVFNIVDNALDAATTAVRVAAARDAADRVVIGVTDDGPDPGEATVARLYEPFFTTKPDGAGMGLAIADALVADLGGHLRHDRHHGTTRFLVTLPLDG